MPREVEHTPDEAALLKKFARLKGLQESASASKQAAVESDEEARRRRRELAVKALKKSLAQQEAHRREDEHGESRSTNLVENTRPSVTPQAPHEPSGSARPAVKGLSGQKELAPGVASLGSRSGHSTGNYGMKRKPVQEPVTKDAKPHRLFPGKEEVVYEDI